MSKQIQLSQGKVTSVDDADYEYFNQWNWSARFDGSNWYAERTDRSGSRQTAVKLHRAITNAPDGMEVDHRDGDGLNNTRENLRVCTHAKNVLNSGLRKDNVTGFKGVSVCKKKYRAAISFNHEWMHIGVFSTAEEAARAYDAKASELFGEFARLNFANGAQS